MTTINLERDQLRWLMAGARDDEQRQERERECRPVKAILDCLIDAVVICDAAGKIVHMNRAAAALAGSQPGDAGPGAVDAVTGYGLFLSDGVTPFGLGDGAWRRVLKGEPTDDVEALVRNAAHPEGVHLSVNGRPFFDEAGRLLGGVVSARDVSDRKRVEQELARQNRLLQSVVDCVAETVSVYDTAGRLILSNPAFDRLIGKKFAANTPVEERSLHYGLFTADGQHRLTREESCAMRAMGGEIIEDLEQMVRSPIFPEGLVISTNAVRLVDDAGAVVGAVVTGRDVSVRRLGEEMLARQTTLLSSILDCLGEGVLVYDATGRVVLTNPAAERMVGATAAKIKVVEERAKTYQLFALDGTLVPVSQSAFGRAFRGEPCDDLELIMHTAENPEGQPLSTNGRPLRGGDGKIQGAVVTLRDITARWRADKKTAELVVELERSNGELAQFAYVASHDLRAPLRAIQSLAGWLEEDLRLLFTPETAEQMRLLRGRIARMDRLLMDLLEFSRVGSVQTDVVPIDVGRLIAEVVDLAAPSPAFRILKDVKVGTFETAPLPLKRALLNLVSNALKHHDRPQGTIQIAARENGRSIEFEIRDDGPGIPPQFHAKVFEMFQTLQSRDKREGSGMGLALVRKIVDQACGTVTLESQGRGASFRVAWPRVWPTRSAAAPAPALAKPVEVAGPDISRQPEDHQDHDHDPEGRPSGVAVP
jgi:signal transduction histidine kinase